MAGIYKAQLQGLIITLSYRLYLPVKIKVEQLLITMESFTNPFKQDSGGLFNLLTKIVMSENVKKDLCEQSNFGLKLFKCFVKERIQLTR